MAILFLCLLIILESVADIFAKEFSLKNKIALATVALLCYLIANTCWLVSLRYKSQLAIGANIFSVAQGILALAIGVWIYNEELSIQQYIGAALGFVAVVL